MTHEFMTTVGQGYVEVQVKYDTRDNIVNAVLVYRHDQDVTGLIGEQDYFNICCEADSHWWKKHHEINNSVEEV